jgi:peptidyl-prolyl cis-trans isomerase SurA
MRHILRHSLIACLMTLGLLAVGTGAGQAQSGQFKPALKVNDLVITKFELNQRILMLQLFNTPGDIRKLAEEQLIDDRLRIGAASEIGVALNPEQVQAGMAEFAARGNLTADQFLQALGQAGVAPQSFRDFVEAGVAWRQVVRRKFAPKVQISEAEIDRALAGGGVGGGGLRVLISEIFLPVKAGSEAETLALAQRIRSMNATQFAQAAREYSSAPTASAGGRVNWMPAANLSPQLRGQILPLRAGQVSQPVKVDGAIALFLMRAKEDGKGRAPAFSAIEYAAYYIAGGRSPQGLAEAAKIKARVDTCDDLYGVAKGQPAEVLDRGSKAPAEIPTDISLELAKLDPGEVSTALTRAGGETLVFLMLCGRSFDLSGAVTRDGIALDLQNQRLGSFAEGFLQQLRAEARIIRF